jgi:protein phosphatase
MSIPAVAPAVDFGGHTDVGRRRGNNEDAFRCDALEGATRGEGALLVVSDGVGGAKAGEIASRTVVDGVHSALVEWLGREAPPADRRAWLANAIRVTDERIREAGRLPGFKGMGATLALVWLQGRTAWWANAGDSRIYLLRGGALRQISHDQSPVGRLRLEEKITEEESRVHPYRHIIDQCLGGGGPPVEPELGAEELAAGDVWLLCSDGLSDGLWDRELAAGLAPAASGQPPEETARELVRRANDASGRDNITAIVARINSLPPASHPAPSPQK